MFETEGMNHSWLNNDGSKEKERPWMISRILSNILTSKKDLPSTFVAEFIFICQGF